MPVAAPLDRLREYCRGSRADMVGSKCRKGCLIGNLSQEMADQSEVLRLALSAVMARRRELFAACIAEGQVVGEVKANVEPDKAAELFLSAWEGALMRAKTSKCADSLDICGDYLIEHLLAT